MGSCRNALRFSDTHLAITDFNEWLAHLAAFRRHHRTIMNEMLKRRWANLAFSQYCLSQKVIDWRLRQIVAGHIEDGTAGVMPTVVFGDARFRTSVPIDRIRHAAISVFGRANVHSVSEFRSTKCCAWCGAVLQHCYSADVPGWRTAKDAHRAAQ